MTIYTAKQMYLDRIDELIRKIQRWHDIMEKNLSKSSTHLFKEIIEVYKDMEKELNDI